MGLFGNLASWAGQKLGVSGGPVRPVTQGELHSLFGPPPPPNATQDQIASEIFVQPYRGPLDLDRYGCETPEMRHRYRTQYREVPVLRAAVSGKTDDVSVLEPTVLAADKDDALSNSAAEFVKWTVGMAPGGWGGLIECLLGPGIIDGFALAEKKLAPMWYKGRLVWGLGHVRSLDTAFLRLELDQFRNVVSVVNLVRGIERYDPSEVLLYSHKPQYSNPFGQSDLRAATRAANIIEDVYKVWYVALKVYGLPYMKGKYGADTRAKQLAASLKALREGGYAVTHKDDDIEVLNLAAAAAVTGFEAMVHTQREDIFFAVRGVAQPFMEGDGGSDAHTDTSVQQGTSDAGEKRAADRIADVINRQLIPWLVGPNFDFRAPDGTLDLSRLPRVKLGGTDWKQVQTILGIIEKAQTVGMEPSAEWAHEAATIPAARDAQDKLVSAQEKQQAQQQQAQAAQPAPAQPGAQPAHAAQPQPSEPPAQFSDAVVWVSPSRLTADPARFQFRRGADAADGTVRDLPDEAFDPRKRAEPFLAWRDPADGQDYVVDGHHGLAWAERDGAKRVPVRWLNAKTAEEAREIGRRANMSARPAKTFSAHAEPHRSESQWADELIAEFGRGAA